MFKRCAQNLKNIRHQKLRMIILVQLIFIGAKNGFAFNRC